MNEILVPISVHYGIPLSECKPPILWWMDPDDIDESLAANFTARMAGRSVGALRQEMADKGITIGSGAIQAAKQGSRGLRLETLQKFADFFGCTVLDLLQSPHVQEGWPFGDQITEAQFRSLDSDSIQPAIDVLVGAIARQAVMKKLGAPAPAQDSRVGEFIEAAPAHDLDSGYGDLGPVETLKANKQTPKLSHRKAQPKRGKK